MGLDIVDMMMEIEEEFKITIADQDASKLTRLGDFQAIICRLLEERGVAADPADIWNRLKRIVMKYASISEDKLTPMTDIIYDLGLD